LTIPLFRLKFLLETVTNKGVVSVRREGGKYLNNNLIIKVIESLSFKEEEKHHRNRFKKMGPKNGARPHFSIEEDRN